METYPLILDGAETGAVTVRREGGWTIFDVRSDRTEGIVRVSVYGEGREGYLGVLAPEGNGLTLHRRVSRSELRAFPAVIEYAGRAGRPASPEEDAATEEKALPEPEAIAPQSCPLQSAPVEEPPPLPEPELPAAEPTPEDRETPPGLEDVYWYASPDGALVCFDGQENLIALPLGDERIPEGGGGWPQTIEGRDYVVFRTRGGRLVR